MKSTEKQDVGVRSPRQQRSRQKVELILEATVRVLDRDGMEGLTTNAVAAAAGVSIGTLYQYFRNKEAILDALADREAAGMSARVVAVMKDETIGSARERVAAVVSAVAATYGGRTAAYRLTMAHSLSRGGNRLAPLLVALRTYLSSERSSGQFAAPLDAGDAFVLAHAFRGILRAMTSEDAPPQGEIERSLTRLVVSYLS